MAKTGFIKIKDKSYKKEFSKENLEKIWDFFKEHFSNVKNRDIDWDKEHYLSFVTGTNNVPLYPETDKWDDTEGISAKQLKEIISYMGFENFKLFALVISKRSYLFCSNDKEVYDSEINILSWKKAIKKHILPKIRNNENLIIGRSLFYLDFVKVSSFEKIYFQKDFPYNIEDEVFKEIIKDNSILSKLRYIKEKELYPIGTTISLDMLNFEEFFQQRKNDWKEKRGFIPTNQDVLFLDPEYWDKDSFLSGMQKLYKTKQLRNLTESEQKNYVFFYRTFGKTIPSIAHIIKEEENVLFKNTFLEFYNRDIPKSFLKILDKNKKGIDIGFSSLKFLFVLNTISLFKGADESFLNKDKITIEDLHYLYEIGELFYNFNREFPEKYKSISWEEIKVFYNYNIPLSNLLKYLDLFLEVKDTELKHIPLVKGSVEEYTYEILPKSDIRGLICGHATNCCQHLNGAGSSCTLFGAKEEDSAFFIVSKNGSIVAQSWLWIDDSKKTMVCDSVEALNRSSKIQECYNKMADDVLNNSKIKEVRVGACSVLPEELDLVNSIQLPKSYNNLYSDAETQYILARKKKLFT
jgi:uncharacterized protein with HEPN domain